MQISVLYEHQTGRGSIRLGEDDPVYLPLDRMPTSPVGIGTDSERPITGIHFDGHYGQVQRRSKVLGRIDIENFAGAECLQAYLDAAKREKDRIAEEKRRQQEEATRLAAESEERNRQAAAAPPGPAPEADNERVRPNKG